MFLLLYVLWIAGVIFFSFAAFMNSGVGFFSSFLVVVFGLVGMFVILQILNIFLLSGLNQSSGSSGWVTEPEQRKRIRWTNRNAFWSRIFLLLVITVVGYFIFIGIPYVFFDKTLGDAMSFFFQNQVGQMLLIQLVGVMPMWFILPFMYFFAFYGPFVIKVLFFDMKVISPGSVEFNVKREDIIAQDENLEELEMILQNVMDRKELREEGKRPERGTLIIGPPGTGKTHTLKYLASRFGLALVIVQSTISRQTFIGVAVIAVWIVRWRATRLAKKYDGAVVIFDEVDLIAQQRSNVTTSKTIVSRLINHVPAFGGMDDSAIVVLMTWMDGVDSGAPLSYNLLRGTVNSILDATFIDEFVLLPLWNVALAKPLNIVRLKIPYLQEPFRLPGWKISGDDGIIFFGTTNRPQVLDPAITRYGRFSPVFLYYDLPDEEGRLAYVDYLLKQYTHVPELDKPEQRLFVARITEGLAQANISFVINKAWLTKRAIWKKDKNRSSQKTKIDLDDIMESRDMLRHGIAKLPRPSLFGERRKVAIHEAGHFILRKEVSGDNAIQIHLSAKRRGKSYGRVESLPVTPVDIQPQRFYEEQIRVCVASHATERKILGENTSGVGGDLASATYWATLMVEFFGMNPRICSDTDRNKFQAIGKKLTSWRQVRSLTEKIHLEYSPLIRDIFGDDVYLDAQFGENLIDSLSFDRKADIETIIGQAYVFDVLFIEKNAEVIKAIAQRLEEAGWEIRGEALQKLDKELNAGLKGDRNLTIKPVSAPPANDEEWPILEIKDPFYRSEIEQGGSS